jgi:hypothetical protein
MKILVVILTSGAPELARLCYDSIAAQQQHELECDVIVVVNSLDPGHESAVRRVMLGTRAEIVTTPSNGMPGMGHNSVISLFRERTEYDYLVPMDGDDFLYPCAFHQLEKLLQSAPHCIGLQTLDNLTREDSTTRWLALERGWKLLSWFDDQENWWRRFSIPNPFQTPPEQWVAPARPVIISREALNFIPEAPYAEDMPYLEDLVCFLKICEAYYPHPQEFRLVFTSNTYIYLTNDMYTGRASKKKIDYQFVRERFSHHVEGRFPYMKQWQLGALPHANVTNPEWFRTADKIAFANRMTKILDGLGDLPVPAALGQA